MSIQPDDDLTRRLADALDTGLAPLIADAAALRTGAKAGSRRIRRRRRVAAGALTVAVIGGLGALALPREQDGPPRPLPVATPTISHTGATHEPTTSSSATPSRQVSTSPGTATPTATATSTPTGTSTAPATGSAHASPHVTAPTRRTTSTGLGYSTDKSTWTGYGAYKPADWLLYTSGLTNPVVNDLIGPGGTWSDPQSALLAPPRLRLRLDASAEGLVAQRQWDVTDSGDDAHGSYQESVTAWAPGYAVARMRDAGHWGSKPLIATDNRYLDVLDTDAYYAYGARGLVRVGDVIIGVFVSWPRDEPVSQAATRVTQILDALEAVAKARGTR